MRRVLKGITLSTYEILTKALTIRWAKEFRISDGETDLYDVSINDDVILKSYSSHVVFELSDRIATLDNCEFVSVEIV